MDIYGTPYVRRICHEHVQGPSINGDVLYPAKLVLILPYTLDA